jgi:hypothetical protein
MAAPFSTRQLVTQLTEAFNTLKAQVAQLVQNGTGGGPVDVYTKAETNTLLAGKASRQDIADLIGAAPAALDTLAELAAQQQADEKGTAAILATQQQHTQQIAALQAGGTGSGGSGQPGAIPVFRLPIVEDGSLLYTLNDDGTLASLRGGEEWVRNIMADYLAGGATTKPTPAKPFLQGYDQTNILSATAVGPMEYRSKETPTPAPIGSGAGTSYSASLPVGNYEFGEGFFEFRVMGTAAANPSAWSRSPAFTVAATTTAPNLLPASEAMNANPPWSGNQVGIYRPAQPAPDGTNSLWVLTAFTDGAAYYSGEVPLENSETYCLSAIFHAKSYDNLTAVAQFRLASYPLIDVAFDMATASVGTATNGTGYITDLSGQGPAWAGFYLAELTFQAFNNAQQFRLYLAAGNGATLETMQWQINKGARRSAYQPTYLAA